MSNGPLEFKFPGKVVWELAMARIASSGGTTTTLRAAITWAIEELVAWELRPDAEGSTSRDVAAIDGSPPRTEMCDVNAWWPLTNREPEYTFPGTVHVHLFWDPSREP